MVQQRTHSGAPLDVAIGPVKQFGRFTLVKKLATGGMAEIWLARQSGLAGFNRFVVIKKILSHLAEEDTFVKMFLDEARMSSQLTHPNIVQVYDLGEAEGTYFIAMEFISGENLAAVAWRGVKRKRSISPPFAARIIADGCKALHYAHHMKGSDGVPLQIVHRDISPQNILVTYEGEVKVVDFGIAKAATKSQHTKTGMLKGKFSYMSPEQCLGNPVDKRSDIFALGIVLYELCTGKRLFKHESELMILEMITKRRITPPSDVAPNIAPELEDIILTALEKDVDRRFQTAQDMQIALEDYLRTEARASTNADLSGYMRDLFADKMEEKRRLVELASREDFLQKYGGGDNEITEDSYNPGGTKRRVVYGRPSDIRVSGVMPHQMTGGHMPGMHGGSGMGMPAHPTGSYAGQPGHTGSAQYPYPPGMTASQAAMMSPSAVHAPYAETSNWGPRIVIAVALVVIIVATAYLYHEIPGKSDQAVIPPPMPPRIGWIEIDSVPDGATIYVDDKTVKLEGGDEAKTPIEQLTPLEYGRTYRIRLIKKGFEPYSETIVMGDEKHGTRIKPTLKAIPATVIAAVRGEPYEAKIMLNGREIKFGRDVTEQVEPGPVKVTATAEGWVCKAQPETLKAEPGSTVRSIISCRDEKTIVRRTPRRTPRTTTPRTTPKRPKRGPKGCQIDPSAPHGYVTLNSTPYSEIYLNGKKIGDTPMNKKKLPAGCLWLEAVHPGPPKRTKRVQVKVESNTTLRYNFKL